MPWPCQLCTFENVSDRATHCGMCGSKDEQQAQLNSSTSAANENNDSNGRRLTSTTQMKSPQQLTLFGKPVPKSSLVSKPRKSSKAQSKTKASSSSSSTRALSNKSKTLESNQSTLSAKNLPLSKSKTSKAHRVRDHSFSFHVRTTPPSSQEISDTLKRVFGLEKLRTLQDQVITTALQPDTGAFTTSNPTSQLVVLATGGGKSLCYQLPACVLGGVTIVISPLIALMKDQVLGLEKKKIPAACLCSANTEKENSAILDRLFPKKTKADANAAQAAKFFGSKDKPSPKSLTLLYITPESIQTNRMQRVLHQLNEEKRLAMFAVDEAHCLSSWGHDFRPAYRKLSMLRTQFANVPCMACTATATPKVIQDIQSCLQLPVMHKGRLDRHNIYYKVKYKDAFIGMDSGGMTALGSGGSQFKTAKQMKNDKPKTPLEDLQATVRDLFKEHSGKELGCCGIVYVHKRSDASQLANAIGQTLGDLNLVGAYHAGLSKKERTRVQDGFSNRMIPVVVATIAFGMGIDVSNVRFVIHWNMSKSLEAFTQESGRAGRDGLPSHSILYYDSEDFSKYKYLISQQYAKEEPKEKNAKRKENLKRLMEAKLKALQDMKDYCIQTKCRRNTLVAHFGGDEVQCDKTCDYCANPARVSRDIQSSLVAPSGRMMRATSFKSSSKEWDGQWDRPHGGGDDDMDDEDAIASDWGDGYVGDLQVTSSKRRFGGDHGGDMGGFATASSMLKSGNGKKSIRSVLNKYERMEKTQTTKDDSDAFDRPAKSTSVYIPEHFKTALAAAPKKAPEVEVVKVQPAPTKSSSDLQKELDQLNAERQARLQKLLEAQRKRKQASRPTSSSSAVPPPVTFGSSKRRRT